MKKCKILFIISMALMLFFVTFGRNKVYANKINNLETSDYDANLDIEFDDSIEELKKLLLYYQKPSLIKPWKTLHRHEIYHYVLLHLHYSYY